MKTFLQRRYGRKLGAMVHRMIDPILWTIFILLALFLVTKVGYAVEVEPQLAVETILSISPPLPPPMTQAEVYAQQLYDDNCFTTRDGIPLSCQAAFRQDLDRAYAWEEARVHNDATKRVAK